ncbi:hypothetical protein B566_EDAN011424 [Ephemera danica]|nr:hypothetical protein B566_EDAN011424 [Ephemera danica]
MNVCGGSGPIDPIDAIKTGKVEVLREYLATDQDQLELTKLLTEVIVQGEEGSRGALVQAVLEHGADVERVETARHCSPLHLAVARGQSDVVRVLLARGARPGARTTSSETVLHYALRGLKDDKPTSDEQSVLACLELIPLNDELINAQDESGGLTAIHLAAKFKMWRIARLLLQRKAHVDIKIRDSTARSIIADNAKDLPTDMIELLNQIPIREKPPKNLVTMLRDALKKNDEDVFLNMVENNDSVFHDVKDVSYGLPTLLQMAASNGHLRATKKLLQVGADVNLCRGTLLPPAMEAARNGHADILELLLKVRNCDLSKLSDEYCKMTTLHETVTSQNCKPRCVELLLENAKRVKLDINAQDDKKYTALHYAAKANQADIIALLLNYNANIFINDYEGIPAFFYINAQYITDFLDSRIETENSMKDRDYTLVLNYDFMAGPEETETREMKGTTNDVYISVPTESTHLAPISNTESAACPEMDALLQLASSYDHRQLLTHPLIKSFLHLKWYRIFWFFYVNFIFYLLFTLGLSVHVYNLVTSDQTVVNASASAGDTDSSNDPTTGENDGSEQIWWIATLVLMVCLVIREVFQLVVSFWRYWSSAENWLEIILLVLTGILLLAPIDTYSLHSIAAIAVLLAYTELVLLVGRHPSLATYITMFFRVSCSFVYFLLWYSLLILGFGFAFYIVFQKCSSAEDCENNFFVDLGTSIFRTIIMLTGEFEAGSLSFDSYSFTSHLIFLLFLFFIAIVLLNLLNGLAVSDTQIIRDEAEVVCCVAQVKLYSRLESILLTGTSLRFCGLGQWIASKILLMPRLTSYDEDTRHVALRVKLNKGNEMEPDVRGAWRRGCTEFITGERGASCCMKQNACLRKACRWCLVFNTIVGDAQAVVAQRGHLTETQQILERLNTLERAIEKIAQVLDTFKR